MVESHIMQHPGGGARTAGELLQEIHMEVEEGINYPPQAYPYEWHQITQVLTVAYYGEIDLNEDVNPKWIDARYFNAKYIYLGGHNFASKTSTLGYKTLQHPPVFYAQQERNVTAYIMDQASDLGYSPSVFLPVGDRI